MFEHGVTTDGECIIGESEWFGLATKVNSLETALLLLLKKKNAPINGIIYLTPDTENFLWQRKDLNFSIRFKWKRIKKDEPKVEVKT